MKDSKSSTPGRGPEDRNQRVYLYEGLLGKLFFFCGEGDLLDSSSGGVLFGADRNFYIPRTNFTVVHNGRIKGHIRPCSVKPTFAGESK